MSAPNCHVSVREKFNQTAAKYNSSEVQYSGHDCSECGHKIAKLNLEIFCTMCCTVSVHGGPPFLSLSVAADFIDAISY